MENADDDLLGIAAMATAPEGAGGAAEPSEGDDDDPDIAAPADAPVDALAGFPPAPRPFFIYARRRRKITRRR